MTPGFRRPARTVSFLQPAPGRRFEQFPAQLVQLDMKARRILWPVLVLATGVICWRSIPPAPQPRIPVGLALNTEWGKKYFNGLAAAGRIKVESDIADIPSMGGSADTSDYGDDPYFMQVNDCRQILIPASASKPERREIVLPQ